MFSRWSDLVPMPTELLAALAIVTVAVVIVVWLWLLDLRDARASTLTTAAALRRDAHTEVRRRKLRTLQRLITRRDRRSA